MNRLHRATKAGSAGFTYIALLFAIAIMGAVLAASGMVWHQGRQREKEQELLFVGGQFRQAIGLYYEHTPGAVKRYPQRLEDLLADPRQIGVQRYLRKIYRDPMTAEIAWGLVHAPEGGIMGVYSLSQEEPIKTGGFNRADSAFEGVGKYVDWRFISKPAEPAR